MTNSFNPFFAADGYKTGHHLMYPEHTTLVYSNFTPRNLRHAPTGITKVVSFGQQMIMKQIHEMFDNDFFGWQTGITGKKNRTNDFKTRVCDEIKKEYSLYLGTDYDVSHIEKLWDLGYLPIKVKSLPEGTTVPIGVPVLTIYNTKPEFYWLTNFLETLISNLLWKSITSATIALQFKRVLTKWALKTDEKNIGFVDFQAHDFSMRGLSGVDSVIQSGLGHATSFMGSDSLPVIYGARKYYGEEGFVIGSVNAAEHSVICAGGNRNEIDTFRYLMKQFPTGILSVISDTWDLWKVLLEYLPILKDEILKRDGKLVIRPDSGNPVDIICGHHGKYDIKYFEPNKTSTQSVEIGSAEHKGVIEILWDLFGGTVNKQGYKVLDPHIGAIYGDAITLDRANEICDRLEKKGFASTNIVLGIGSFTYQYNTRDTFGFAMKATYVEFGKWAIEQRDISNIGEALNQEFIIERKDINEEEGNLGEAPLTYQIIGKEIFKDPITDRGDKKSAKGLLSVGMDRNMKYELYDQVTWETENNGQLKTIFEDGKFVNEVTLTEIRERIKKLI